MDAQVRNRQNIRVLLMASRVLKNVEHSSVIVSSQNLQCKAGRSTWKTFSRPDIQMEYLDSAIWPVSVVKKGHLYVKLKLERITHPQADILFSELCKYEQSQHRTMIVMQFEWMVFQMSLAWEGISPSFAFALTLGVSNQRIHCQAVSTVKIIQDIMVDARQDEDSGRVGEWLQRREEYRSLPSIT